MAEPNDDEIAAWRQLKRAMTRDAFAARFTHPFLLRRRLARTSGVGHFVTDGPTGPVIDGDFVERLAFETKVSDDLPKVAPPPTGRLTGGRIVAVAKVPGNPFPERISVGRALNCDIVLRDPSVSKLHGHFRVLSPASAELTDARSANRTSVNGSIVDPAAPARVGAGDTIVFGSVAVQFLDARALHDLL